MKDNIKHNYFKEHIRIISCCYLHWTRINLVDLSDDRFAEYIFNAPFALVSHGTQKDPIFNYANKKALELWEYSFEEFTQLPSRKSAAEVSQKERNELISHVTKNGFYEGYRGVRISKTGKKFEIKDACIWNLFKDEKYYGQAALIRDWMLL